MNQIQISAQITALVEQRNAAQNQVVNLTGALAVANATIKELTDKLDATNAQLAVTLLAETKRRRRRRRQHQSQQGAEVIHG